MAKHAAVCLVYLALVLHCWLFMDAHALSVPASLGSEQMKVAADSSSIDAKRLTVKELPVAERSGESSGITEITSDMPARSAGSDHFPTIYDDSINSHGGSCLTGRCSNSATKRSAQEQKRRLRLVKRRESGEVVHGGKDATLRFHSLHKRETNSRDRRTLSINNALSVLSDMVVEHEQRRLAEERAELRRRLLAVGKRSEDTTARKYEAASQEDRDFVSILQKALASSDTN